MSKLCKTFDFALKLHLFSRMLKRLKFHALKLMCSMQTYLSATMDMKSRVIIHNKKFYYLISSNYTHKRGPVFSHHVSSSKIFNCF